MIVSFQWETIDDVYSVCLQNESLKRSNGLKKTAKVVLAVIFMFTLNLGPLRSDMTNTGETRKITVYGAVPSSLNARIAKV